MRIRINNHTFAPSVFFSPLSRGSGSTSEERLHYIEPLEKQLNNTTNLHKIQIKTIDTNGQEIGFNLKFPNDFETIEFLALSYKIIRRERKKLGQKTRRHLGIGICMNVKFG